MLRANDEIVMSHIYPPIPVRDFDWQAVWDNDEPDDDGRMLVGHGRTPLAAMVDLLESTEIHEELAEMYRARKRQRSLQAQTTSASQSPSP